MSGDRVVVVDDDEAFLDIVGELLTSEGFDVMTTARWQDSFALIKDSDPAVVVLDLVMQQSEIGWAVLDVLRSEVTTRHVPVIVCSAAVPALEQRQPLLARYGALALAKPFDVEELLDSVREAIAGSRVAWRSSATG